jgi:hypothetical protein
VPLRHGPELAAALGGLRTTGGVFDSADPSLLRFWTAVDRGDWQSAQQTTTRQQQQPPQYDPAMCSVSPSEAVLKCSHAAAQLATSLRFPALDPIRKQSAAAAAAAAAARTNLEAAAAALCEPLRWGSAR